MSLDDIYTVLHYIRHKSVFEASNKYFSHYSLENWSRKETAAIFIPISVIYQALDSFTNGEILN